MCSQYHNGEACTDCNCPGSKHCKQCHYPMCECCYKQNNGLCAFCRNENKVTVTPGTMDDNYAHYEHNQY